MKKRFFTYAAILAASMAMYSCGGAATNGNNNEQPEEVGNVAEPSLCGMKCEFVPAGGEAVIYGKNLKNAEVSFEGGAIAKANKESNDSVLKIIVPESAGVGPLTIKTDKGTVVSDFIFRDNRNPIINFDEFLATWGGYEAFDKGEKITSTMETGELPAVLPDQISGKYGFLFGKYVEDWTMTFSTYLQYCANPDEGGRGNVSVAGNYKDMDLADLALKFEVYIPKEASYEGPKTEIFFGPIDAENKHGRELSALYFWRPFENGAYSTEGWTTVTIPLNQFVHDTKSDSEESGIKIDLNKATNFSFVLFGQAKNKDKKIYMCVDNFRVVPLKRV